jgi:sugar-specific transcriptional regulator TrmB
MTQWKKLLKSLGFTESEAGIYLTSLEMGPSSVQDIAKRAHVSRVTTYAVIESLSERGLMSSVEKGKKHFFVAESPERLVSFVGTRVREMEATLKEVESSLQDLKLLQRGEKPIVKMFEGHEALKAIQDDILRTRPKQVDEFGNLDEIRALYPLESMQSFVNELKRMKPDIRTIYHVDSYAAKPENRGEKEIHIKDASFGGDLIIYGNKVAISSCKGKLLSVLIESQELAQLMRALFSRAWMYHNKKA